MNPISQFLGQLPNGSTDPAPLIEVYRPKEEASNRRALVILPGGGYQGLAEHEGRGYAEWYTQHGYSCFVVTYRLGPEGFRHPAMLEDAAAAVHTVRQRSGEYGIEPKRIGIIGSSAGGHLAATLMVHYKRFLPTAESRPDLAILSYPVISFSGEFRHTGSRDNLLGPDPDQELVDEVSCEKHVQPDTPPCFLWHTADDPVVMMQHSLVFADALTRKQVLCELHVYARGAHGLGLNTSYPWGKESLRWMDQVYSDQTA